MTTDTAGTAGKHFARHRIANGQDFAQPGSEGFSFGQHGMSSGIEAVSDMPAIAPAIDASLIVAALDGAAIGAIRRPAIARIESRRDMNKKSCTSAGCHDERGGRRARLYTIGSTFADPLRYRSVRGRASLACDPLWQRVSLWRQSFDDPAVSDRPAAALSNHAVQFAT